MLSVLSGCLVIFLSLSLAEAGVSYVRWGRQTCPSGNILLYTGYMAGSKFDLDGSGSNYVCMHKDPQFVNPTPGKQDPSGYIYGVEIDLNFKGLFKADNIPGGTISNNDMLCSVCHVPDSSDELVVYGRQDCGNSGYELQYKGFLVSEFSKAGRGRGQFVCLDETPEGRIGGTADNNQAIVYPVQLGCGSLPCNPFVEGYEVTCAVCTY